MGQHHRGKWFDWTVGGLAILSLVAGGQAVGYADSLASPRLNNLYQRLQRVTSVVPANPKPNRPAVQAPTPPLTTPPLAQRPAPNRQLMDANTRFGFNLYAELLKQNSRENLFVSPSSVSIALSMLYNGASGETQRAMAKTLAVQNLSLPELNQANADLMARLTNPDEGVQLAIANSLWAKQGIPFKPDFLRRNQEFFRAEVTELNFNTPQAVSIINQWVAKQTRGKITEIVDSIDPDDVMFLINAIYFKGAWSAKFDPAQTQNQPFYTLEKGQKSHPLMAQRGEYRYYETAQFQAISLPYGTNRRLSFYVFLPKPNSSLQAFHQTLTPENWQDWMSRFQTRPGTIQLPRFKLEYKAELKDALSALGMGVAFNPLRANFANLSSQTTRIDEVKHKTFVEVNEAGTEAAAVTSIGIRATSAPMPVAPFQMVVNRPFFCAIRDNQTGTVLFMGAIVDPS